MYFTKREKKKIVIASILGGVGALLFVCGACGKKTEETYRLYFYNDESGKATFIDLKDDENNVIEPPVREGYVFLGYYNGLDLQYFDENGNQSAQLLLTDGLRLTAKWNALDYSLSFDLGNDPLFSMETTEMTAHYGEKFLSFPVPTVNDPAYEFVGWFNADKTVQYSDGTGAPLLAEYTKENYSIEEFSTTLYAVLQDKVCTVTLDFNDDLATPSVAFDLPYGAQLPDLAEYARDNGSAETVGWSLSRYSVLAPSETVTDDCTLYAVWKQYKNVEFVYGSGDIRTHKVYESLGSSELPFPEKAGYAFEGWYFNETFSDGGVFAMNFGLLAERYYAKWSETDYKLTFQANNGETYDPIVYGYGEERSLPNPEKEGYDFKGWSCTKNGEVSETDKVIYSLTADLYGDFVLVAKWEAAKYAVTLDPCGGELSAKQAVLSYEQDYELKTPKKTGYTFVGWFDSEEDGATAYTDANGVSKTVWAHAENGKTLYAKWKINTYTVRYETGSDSSSVRSQTYEHGSAVSFPEKPVHANGKYFNGWYDETLTTEYTEKTLVLSDMVLYANWLDSTPISTADDLMTVWENPSANYHLTQDINLSGQQWACIEEFSGTFNGDGYKIYNFILSCNSNAETVYFGFIGKNSGTIKNVIFDEVALGVVRTGISTAASVGETYAGIIAGRNTGRIIGCEILENSTVQYDNSIYKKERTGRLYIGGLVGCSTGTMEACVSKASFESCKSSATGDGAWGLTAKIYINAGGVVGRVEEGGTVNACSYDGNILVLECYTGVKSSLTELQIGGIVGHNNGDMEQCSSQITVNLTSTEGQNASANTAIYLGGSVGYNTGKIQSSYAIGSFVATGYRNRLGGFVGFNNGEIGNCYTTIDMESNGYYTGGFISYNAGTVSNSYALGNVDCGLNYSQSYHGGFVGYNASGAVIMRSFSIGNVNSASETATYSDIFVPSAGNNGTIQRCHYADGATVTRGGTLVTVYEAVTGLTKKTTEELQSADFLYNTLYWDNGVWTTVENGFPKLYWQS